MKKQLEPYAFRSPGHRPPATALFQIRVTPDLLAKLKAFDPEELREMLEDACIRATAPSTAPAPAPAPAKFDWKAFKRDHPKLNRAKARSLINTLHPEMSRAAIDRGLSRWFKA